MIGDKIKSRRLDLQLTQLQVARGTDIKKNTISNYENNISSPSEENLIKLMKFLKCDANYLFEDEMIWLNNDNFTCDEKNHIKKYRTLDKYGKKAVDGLLETEYERCTTEIEEDTADEPMIEIRHSIYKVSAGTGFELSEGDNWDSIFIPDTNKARLADFALTIEGDSMEPVYYTGDIVLVKEQNTIEYGEIGIFTINGAGYIKKFGGDRLISLNEKYDDIEFTATDEIRCCGKVIDRV